MTSFETIEGMKIDTIFDHLINKKVLVKVSLPDSTYENLTLFTAVKKDQKLKEFRMDPPKGLIDNLRQAQSDRLAFEFTGPDQLLHRFDAAPTAVSDSAMWLEFPQQVARYQMRDNFRVKVLAGSYAELRIDELAIRMEIDNLSLGGVYCLCKKKFKPLFEMEHRFEMMTLSVALKNDTFVSTIDSVQVKRIEPQSKPRYFGIAFEFTKMHNDVRKNLVQYIYEMQRQFLQTRLKMEL